MQRVTVPLSYIKSVIGDATLHYPAPEVTHKIRALLEHIASARYNESSFEVKQRVLDDLDSLMQLQAAFMPVLAN